MYTNQDAASHMTAELLACIHAAGQAAPETCRYLRALEALRAWCDRAEQEHLRSACGRETTGELWLLQAQVQYAQDHCPNGTLLRDLVPNTAQPPQQPI